MTRQRIYEGQIRDQLATGGEHSKRLLQRFSSELFQGIQQALLDEGHVRLHRFGSFKLQWSKARRGRHPRTGETITIPAQPRVVFTPAKALREQIANGEAAPHKANRDPVVPVEADHPPPPTTPHRYPPDTVEATPRSVAPSPDRPAPRPMEKAPLLSRSQIALMTLVTLLAVLWAAYAPSPEPGLVDTGIETQNGARPARAPAVETPTAPPASENILVEQPSSRIEPRGQAPATARETTADDTAVRDTGVSQPAAESTEPFFRERPHTLKNGDSLWRLSNKNYINPFYWPHIYQANRNRIKNPNRLLIGQTIRLPELEGRPGKLTDADKRRIAEGYFLAYRYYKKHDRPFPYYALLGAHRFDPSVIQQHIYEIDEKDWENLQLASN